MFIVLTNFHNGQSQRFNVYNIVTYGSGISGGKTATYVEMVNNLERDDSPYFVKETPQEIDDMVDKFSV